MENLKENGALVVKTGLIIIRKTFLYTSVGVFINLLFLTLLFPELESIIDTMLSGGARHPIGLIILLIAWIFYTFLFLGISFTFCIVFPVFYFALGKKIGVEAAIKNIISEKQSTFVPYVGNKMATLILSKKKWIEKTKKVGLQNSVVEFFKSREKKVPTLPRSVRWLIQLLFRKMRKIATYGHQVETHFQGTTPENLPDKISSFLSQLLNRYLENRNSNSLKWLVGMNIGLFLLLKFFL